MADVLNHVSEINTCARQEPKFLIERAENRYDELLNRTVERISKNNSAEIVLLAGPSSSGKTTTAGKISQKLSKKGHTAYTVSLDDFYRNRGEFALDEEGKPDYESVTALELDMLNRVMTNLVQQGHSLLPRYDFVNGKRLDDAFEIRLQPGDVVIFEGLHALNPIISERLPQDALLKLYVSVSTRLYLQGDEVQMTKRDLRLVRRMIRDYRFRNSSVENTFSLWGKVLEGENKFLAPYKYCADILIDSIHNYEPCVFRREALALLDTVPQDSDWFPEACRLKKQMEPFETLSPNLVPQDSLMREFLGAKE
ncbi:MAG TPA: nucleoside kinase [Ruminococcaceae bacterium]|nr:nucleoside kinase [Oscillospiraceae bacterium]